MPLTGLTKGKINKKGVKERDEERVEMKDEERGNEVRRGKKLGEEGRKEKHNEEEVRKKG